MTEKRVTVQVGDVIFVKEFAGLENQEVTDKWVSEDGKFELTRQVVWDDDDEEDASWGVWDVEGDDWAHEPAESGFDKRRDAEAAFIRWQKEVGL